MRVRSVVSFLFGFACGALFITVLLWQTGALHATRAQARGNRAAPGAPAPATPAPAAHLPAPVPPTPAPSTPPAPTSAPQNVPPETVPQQLAQRALTLPVSGINPAELRDDFNETRDGRRHEAIDIAAPRGTPVVAVDEGNVVKLFKSKRGGLTVYQFDDTQTFCYYYAHLERYVPGLKQGQLLRKGEVLGYVGTTGDSPPNAPHLHFAISQLGADKHWWDGTPIDPYPLLAKEQRQ